MKQAIVFMVGIFIGWITQRMLDACAQAIERWTTKNKAKRRIKRDYLSTENILTIAYSYPNFDTEREIILTTTKEVRRLKLPTGVEVDSSEDFSAIDTFDYCDFFPKEIQTELLTQVIEKARIEVATDFANRRNGAYFNGRKFGICCADGFSRSTDNKERPIIKAQLYHTDYFTSIILGKAFSAISELNQHLSSVALANKNLGLFRASLGLSLVVIIPSSNEIIMTRRSQNAAFSKEKAWIYVSVTEAFSEVDYDEYLGTCSVSLCAQRGLYEELGIEQTMYKADSLKVLELFLETNFCQDNFVATVELRESITLESILALRGKDRYLETDSIFTINNSKSSIYSFIKENSDDMRPQTIYSLKSHADRL